MAYITYLGADGDLKFDDTNAYHEDDSEDCRDIAEKFQEFNESSRNALPGKLVLVENFKLGVIVVIWFLKRVIHSFV